MKSLLLALFLGFQVSNLPATVPVSSQGINSITFQNLEDGWYEAVVSYYIPKTYQRSNYTLSVKVQYNRVTVIDFGNGGSVHSGYNNSGYTYYGGSLSFQRDFNGQIASATTQVSVSDTEGTRYYDIKIQ